MPVDPLQPYTLRMTKPNRNDLCPCGSGDKFKKCCIDKPEHLRNWPSQESKPKRMLPPIFTTNNSIDLLKSIAALEIVPENHGKNIRVESLTLAALEGFNSSTKKISQSELKSFINNNYPFHPLEDPPLNLFTDLVSYHGGDYLIFPGITETGSFILSNLLTAIFQWPDGNFPKGFQVNCHHGIKFILSISDVLVGAMGYSRYQRGTASTEFIEFPLDEVYNRARGAIEISKTEMDEILKSGGISKEVIAEFTLDPKLIDFKKATIEDNPLMDRPIIETASAYLIVSPCMLSLALTSFIWNQARTFKCIGEVEKAFNEVVWSHVQFHLTNMGFKALPCTAELSAMLGGLENIYQVDTDKIAHVRFVSQSRLEQNVKHTAAQSSSEDVLSKFRNDPKFSDHQFLEIILISETGQNVAYSIERNKHAKVLAMRLFEFDVLGNLGKSDAIDIWNFVTAIDEQLLERPRIHFSVLDIYKIYKDTDDSFYISDNTKNNVIAAAPGYSAELLYQSKLKKDAHSILINEDGHFVLVPVIRKEKYAPIYCNPNDLLSNVLRFAVEGFHQPVWIMPNFDLDGVHGEFRHMLFELNDAIAFWTWQISDEIKEFLRPLKNAPLSIRYNLVPMDKFKTIDIDFARDPALAGKFKWSVSKDTIVLDIPGEIIPYLYGSDNEGERALVKSLLLSLNDVLTVNAIEPMSADKVEIILGQCAPLGMKKKFFILYSNDNLLLDQRNLVKERRIQDYNVNVVLNSIVPGLGKNAPIIGVLKTKAEKEKLTRDIVVRSLLPALKKAIAQYDCEELLVHLIELNETLIQQRELCRVNTPSRIACYVSVEQHAIDLKKTSSQINRTTPALRCLMEHVAAEQSRGTKIISTTGIDELIALMDQIIAWGSVGDQVKFDLFDIHMSILGSGRVGTDESGVIEVLDPYHQLKIEEDIQDAVNSYDGVFAQRIERSEGDIPEFLDKAFVDDFSISFSRICELIEALAAIAFDSPKSYAKFPFSNLRKRVNKIVTPFDEAEFNAGMDFLTLKKRKSVEDVPPGFDGIDISPWRFNRRLAILRKPIVAVENSADLGNAYLYWGPRQILQTRIYLGEQCLSGRLRVPEGGSVIRALGSLAQEKGDALVQRVFKSVKKDHIEVYTEVWIGPKEFLYNKDDLGDVDVLVIDKNIKTIFSLECKSIEPSRNIKEMVEEVSKLMGSYSEKGLIQKHVERDVWLKNNKPLLGKKYGIDLTDYQIKSFFVTDEGMLTPFLKKQSLPVPFVSKYELEKFGLAALTDNTSAVK